MTNLESTTFIIVGLTKEGRKFRPSDWAERLCGVMSAFGAERKMKYSPYVGPGDYNGEKAVFVDGRLGELEPMAYRFMLNFAQDNDLQIVDGVCPIDKKILHGMRDASMAPASFTAPTPLHKKGHSNEWPLADPKTKSTHV